MATRFAVLIPFTLLAASAGEICVTAVDATKAPLPGATVTAIDGRGHKSRSTTTDEQGGACLNLAEGNYAVEFSLTGFLTVRYSTIRVRRDARPWRLKAELPIGEVTEGRLF
ncbi:MAG: carboxypeptidase-like regulatory domain-containing protein [Bryobacteraceae bacterium]|nr:carboxypeptidase-like regulatory domain-containing protein [Bryobacteraceae bacterium]